VSHCLQCKTPGKTYRLQISRHCPFTKFSNRVVHHLVRGGGKVWAGYIENHINWGVNKDPETLGPNFDDKIVNSPNHKNTKYNTDFFNAESFELG